jgi:hypothetical protein
LSYYDDLSVIRGAGIMQPVQLLGYWLDDTGFESLKGQQIFLFSKTSRTALEPTYGSFPEVKRPGREVDRSLASNADIKNEWSYISTHLHAFMSLIGSKFE